MFHFLEQSATLVPWWGGVIAIIFAILAVSAVPLAVFEMREDRIARRLLRNLRHTLPEPRPDVKKRQAHTWHDNYDLWDEFKRP